MYNSPPAKYKNPHQFKKEVDKSIIHNPLLKVKKGLKTMAREHENYRPTLEQLNLLFPNREYLKREEVARVCACSLRTVDRKFSKEKTVFGISKVSLAKKLCTLKK